MSHLRNRTGHTVTHSHAATPSRKTAGLPPAAASPSASPVKSSQPKAASSSPAPANKTNPARERRQAEFAQRQEERRLARAREQRAKRLKQVVAIGGGILVFGLVVWLIIQASAPPPTIHGVVTYANLSRNHVTGKVTYTQNPPVGGDHNPVWLNCGIYATPVPNENAVHSLEHGAVWITYQPNLPATQVTQLADLVQGHNHAILSPYPGLPAPVVASAWGLQLKVTGASDPRIAQFIKEYESGPQTPEPGAPCSGGVGSPTA